MPLKKEIIPYLDQVCAPGSVNTVVKTPDAHLAGYSTDAQGFYAGLRSQGRTYPNQNVVLIGYGAVTQALAQDALEKDAARVAVLCRTPDKAKDSARHDHVTVDALDRISPYMENCDILINTTPLGMAGTGNDFQDLSFIQMLRPSAIVCDLLYDPPVTRLLAAAQKHGNATLNGLPMLIWQAFYAFEKFFGIMPTRHDYEKIRKKLMTDQ
jgi:shikimate dehydrogenase